MYIYIHACMHASPHYDSVVSLDPSSCKTPLLAAAKIASHPRRKMHKRMHGLYSLSIVILRANNQNKHEISKVQNRVQNKIENKTKNRNSNSPKHQSLVLRFNRRDTVNSRNETIDQTQKKTLNAEINWTNLPMGLSPITHPQPSPPHLDPLQPWHILKFYLFIPKGREALPSKGPRGGGGRGLGLRVGKSRDAWCIPSEHRKWTSTAEDPIKHTHFLQSPPM